MLWLLVWTKETIWPYTRTHKAHLIRHDALDSIHNKIYNSAEPSHQANWAETQKNFFGGKRLQPNNSIQQYLTSAKAL